MVMAAERAPFIDQSQAFSLNMIKANEDILSEMHISTWKMVIIVILKHFIESFHKYNLIFFRV